MKLLRDVVWLGGMTTLVYFNLAMIVVTTPVAVAVIAYGIATNPSEKDS